MSRRIGGKAVRGGESAKACLDWKYMHDFKCGLWSKIKIAWDLKTRDLVIDGTDVPMRTKG